MYEYIVLYKSLHCLLYTVQNLALSALQGAKFNIASSSLYKIVFFTVQNIALSALHPTVHKLALSAHTMYIICSCQLYVLHTVLYYKLALPALHRIQHLHCHLFTVKNVAFLAFMILVLNWWNSWRKTDVYIQYIYLISKQNMYNWTKRGHKTHVLKVAFQRYFHQSNQPI